MTTDDKTTDSTPALLSAARLAEIAAEHRRVAAWIRATHAPVSLERPTAERAVAAIGDLLAHITAEQAMHLGELAEEHGRYAESHGAHTAELAGAHDMIARLESAHLDALTPHEAPDGEALGRRVREIQISNAWAEPVTRDYMVTPWEGLTDTERATNVEIGLALHAIGYAAGRSEGEALRHQAYAQVDAYAIERDAARLDGAREEREACALALTTLRNGSDLRATERIIAFDEAVDAIRARGEGHGS